jgi:GT2 family glycosyltransferase
MTKAVAGEARPDVSVVIPTRNRLPWLMRTLACARRQRGLAVEVVVVDDGSTDGTARAVEQLADPCIRLVRNPSSLGLAGARNAGIHAAIGEWIAFLDDDDLWSPLKLTVQVRAASASAAPWCYGAAAIVDVQGGVRHIADPPEPGSLTTRLRGWNVIPAGASNVVVRADLLQRVGRFDERFHHFADWDLWLRLAAAAPPATVPDVLVAYVEHPGNLRFTEPDVLVRELRTFDAKHRLAGDSESERFAILRWIADAEWRSGRHAAAAKTFARLLRSRGAVSHARWAVGSLRGGWRGDGRARDNEPTLERLPWLDQLLDAAQPGRATTARTP